MRIAQVITLFLPDFVGGATLTCAQIARGLAARGHEVAVFCGRPHADATLYGESAWIVDGIPVTGVNAAPGYATLDHRNYRHPEIIPSFERFLERQRPDVVHFHSIQALGADLLAVAAVRGLPVVLTMHDWWWFCVQLFLVDPQGFICPPRVEPARCHCVPAYDFVTRRRRLETMLAYADRILTPSHALAEAVVANGIERGRVTVSPNGVPPAVRSGVPRPGPVRFGYVGGPDNRLKGLPTLLQAAAELAIGGWQLVLHAVPRQGLPVDATVRDRVRTSPPFAPERLSAVLGELDCMIVPSLMRESYSMVTREALAAGVPVIVSDSGGPAEIVREGLNGLVFATGDANDLAASMRRLVLTPGLLDRLRTGAAATSVPTLADQVTTLERTYAAVVSARRGQPAQRDMRTAPSSPPASLPTQVRSSRVAARLRHVLFVTGMDGPPLRYRVTNLRDQLAHHHIASRVVYFTDPSLPRAIAETDLVIVYRVPMDGWVGSWIAEARRLGRRLVFSCDDLIFDSLATPQAALALLPPPQRAWWLASTERYAATLVACDAFLAPTEPLVAAAARLGIPGFVVRNGLGAAQLEVAEAARRSAWQNDHTRASSSGTAVETVWLGYLSGTNMHDLDFATIEPALAEVLQARPAAGLRLVGHLRTGSSLAPFRDRIERVPFLAWHDLFACLAKIDVNLAPLQSFDQFSDAKSEVKYLEAAVMGIPTVATPTAAFRHVIRDRANGRLAAGRDQWRSALLELIDDVGLRKRLGNAARDDVFLRRTPAQQADALVEALTAIASRVVPSGASRGRREPYAQQPGEIGRYDLEPEDGGAGSAQPAHDTPSPRLTPGLRVGQLFRATADRLYRIDIRVGTDGRVHRQLLTLSLSERADPTTDVLRRASFAVDAFVDGAWIAVEFPPLADCAERTLYFWIEAETPGVPDGVTLWTYVHGWGDTPPSGLHLDHVPMPGSLTFRTFHRTRGGLLTPPAASQ